MLEGLGSQTWNCEATQSLSTSMTTFWKERERIEVMDKVHSWGDLVGLNPLWGLSQGCSVMEEGRSCLILLQRRGSCCCGTTTHPWGRQGRNTMASSLLPFSSYSVSPTSEAYLEASWQAGGKCSGPIRWHSTGEGQSMGLSLKKEKGWYCM